MIIALSAVSLCGEPDVFAARQLARQTAAALGMDTSDQVRVATAVSELGRVMISAHRTGRIDIGVVSGIEPQLLVAASLDKSAAADGSTAMTAGLEAGRRLMDSVSVVEGHPQVIEMLKALPADHWPFGGRELEQLRIDLARVTVTSPLDELRSQNLELVTTLEELRAKQDDLGRLNEELEETNRGVMAMYSQLSVELEETNRGVVALYAELDERGVQLHHASEAKSRFLASVSHELRGPLNVVRGLAGLLQEPDSEPLSDVQIHQVRLIGSSADELLGLVNGLLDLAKAESGKLSPQPVPVRLDLLLADMRATMRPLASKGVELVIDIPEDARQIETDEALLSQLVRNLVTNALKFTEHGSVRISAATEASANLLLISVVDTGVGIAPEHHELVFEEFFQVPGRLQARSRNSGLGLPYARRVAQALGGSLHLASAVDVGSTFTVTLPIQWIAIPKTSKEAESSKSSFLDTVLIIDDEAPFRELLRQMLQGSVGRVVEAADGLTALDMMGRLRPDLVLLDLRMPGGGGEHVLAEASRNEDLREIPIAVVTSVAVDDAALRRLSPTFTILNKSDLTKESLLSTIRSVVAAQGSL